MKNVTHEEVINALNSRLTLEKENHLELVRDSNCVKLASTEVWEELLNHSDWFVSSQGRIVNRMPDGSYKLIVDKLTEDKNHVIRIGDDRYYVHRLVAEYFNAVGRGDKVIHINRDHTDNRVDNLARANKNQPVFTKNIARIYTVDLPIIQYSLNGELIRHRENTEEAEFATGIRKGDILTCAEGDTITARNFIWVFEEIPDKLKNSPSLKNRVNIVKPLWILAYSTDKGMAVSTIVQASRLSGISEKEIMYAIITREQIKGWMFLSQGIKI